MAWKRPAAHEIAHGVAIIEAVRRAIGDDIELMVEFHGRLAIDVALEVIERLKPYQPTFVEEPVAWENLDLLAELRRRTDARVAAGERLYMLADFARLFERRVVDVVQMDVAHCGGILMGKKIAAHGRAARHRIRSPRLGRPGVAGGCAAPRYVLHELLSAGELRRARRRLP